MAKKQETQENPVEEVKYPRYLSNYPKGADLLEGGSQKRLAQAIAAHITEADQVEKPVFARLIGLQGKWGSGKSNVIKILEDEDLKEKYIFFCFDAWGNQEDLQRRSILELLTKELITKTKLTGQTTMRVMKPEGEGKVFPALAKAGDMTIYGKRDNLKILRELPDGTYQVHELDMRDANILNSPYYYLQQRDIVYVEPNEAMAQNSKIGQTTQLWVRGVSITVSLGSLLYRVLQ